MSLETIETAVAKRLAPETATPLVIEKVADAIVVPQIEKRASQIVAAMAARDNLLKTVSRTKPDQRSYDADGNVISETFSANAYKALKEAREKIERITKAIDAALSNGDYQPLDKLNANKPSETSNDDA